MKGAEEQNAILKTPDYVKRVDHISYGPEGEWNKMDLYCPKGAAGVLPCIVNIHGGGWVAGTKESSQHYCMSLVEYGFAVLNFNYRLAPEYRYPACMEDVNRVICWLMEHGKEYGLDTSKVFLVGDSAGAHLAALYSCICTNPLCAEEYDFKVPNAFKPATVVLNCGIYDTLENRTGLIGMLLEELLGKELCKKDLERISPIRYITEAFPPAYVMTSTGDFMKADAPRLTNVLAQKHVAFKSKIYGTEDNQLPHVFQCDITKPEALQCNREECAFLLKYCRLQSKG